MPDLLLRGVQEPSVRFVPQWRFSEGDEACFLATSYGLTPDSWQSLVIDDILAVRKDGRWVSTRLGVSVPRQNGKNSIIEVIELYKIVVLGRRVLHTAHEVKTMRKAYLRLLSFFDNERKFPELARMVKEHRKSNGQEALILHALDCDRVDGPECKCEGGGIEFIARSRKSGRGFTVDDLVMDEAQELSELQYAALLPTVSSAPSGNPQQLMFGTPPGPSDDGEVFGRVRLAAMKRTPRTGWLEWSFEKGSDSGDRAQWARANPALGVRLNVEVIEDEYAAMDDATFRRERGGVWASEAASRGPIDARSWAVNFDPRSEPVDRLALAVDVSPDGGSTAVAVAGVRADGCWHVELVEQRIGTGWVPSRVAEITARHGFGAVVVDGGSPAAVLVEALRGQRVNVTLSGARDMGAASALFTSGVFEGTLYHLGQPQLTAAVLSGRKRAIGTEGLWGWGRATSASDISPLVAATLALWGAQQTDPRRRQKRRRTGRMSVKG